MKNEDEYATIEVDEDVVRQLIFFGFVRVVDSHHVLTETGSKWLREWCAERLKA